MAERKTRHILHGGPFDNEAVFLTVGANTTLTFGLHDFYGRYVKNSINGNMEWQECKREIVPPKAIARHRGRTTRVLRLILGKAA